MQDEQPMQEYNEAEVTAEDITEGFRSKIVFKCADEDWEKLREAHRRKYPADANSMNLALRRAVEEFVK